MNETIPTWGYAKDGGARIFDLAPGESLPDGWADSPARWGNDAPEPSDAVNGAAEPASAAAADDDELLAMIIETQDKDALDEYAAERGIKLDRRKSFENMLTEYRA